MKKFLFAVMFLVIGLSARAGSCPDGPEWTPDELAQQGGSEEGVPGFCFGPPPGGGTIPPSLSTDCCRDETSCWGCGLYYCGVQNSEVQFNMHSCEIMCYDSYGHPSHGTNMTCFNPFDWP